MKKSITYAFKIKGSRFALAEEGVDPSVATLYRKELIYPTKIVKRDQRTGEEQFRLDVERDDLDHWADTFGRFKACGIEVPCPIGHTENPKAKAAVIEDMAVEPNDRGSESLFGYFRFNDAKTAQELKNSNCSIYIPDEFYSGNDQYFERPIRHVAFTDYPVVPGLGKFKPIAASFDFELAEDAMVKPTFSELANAIGVDVPPGASDEEIFQAIVAEKGEAAPDDSAEADEFEELDGEDEDPDMGDEDPDMEDEDSEDEGTDFDPDAEDEDTEEGTPPDESKKKKGFKMSHAVLPTVVRSVSAARRVQLDGLLRERKINVKMHEQLVKDFADEKKVEVALSHEANGSTEGDNFDSTMKMLSLNTPMLNVGEHSGDQAKPPEKSPVVVEAERRAEAAKKK
jgi:hypothetical protein